MPRCRGCFLLISFLLLLPIVSCLSPSIGVNPEEIDRYTVEKTQLFSCRDGSKEIPWEMVNDDYCDCGDGSDEPGTSACGNGFFYCRNLSAKSKFISSSFVNDGVCDCCDGSDENDGNTVCPNTCEEERAVLFKKLAAEMELHTNGLVARSAIVEDSSRIVNEKTAKLGTSKVELETLTSRYNILKGQRDGVDEVVSKLKATRAERDAANKADYEARLEAAKQAAAQQQREAGTPEEQIDTSAVVVEPMVVVEDPKTQEEIDLETLDATIDPLNRDIENLKKEISDIESFLNTDFGPNREWASLHHKCFKNFIRTYNYEVCLFKNAQQGYTDIGKFDKWLDVHAKHFYANGARCWQGPNRQVTVTFVCGNDHQIVSVTEPETCKYEITLTTPMACSAETVQLLKMEMNNN